MKLPKLVILCLIVLTALPIVGLGMWWTMCPRTDARRFVELVVDGKLDEANSIMIGAQWTQDADSGKSRLDIPPVASISFAQPQIAFEPRDVLDLVRGRQAFTLVDRSATWITQVTQKQVRFIAGEHRIEIEWLGRDI